MTETAPPYVTQEPGDLVTADAWNTMQVRIHEDIRTQAAAAAEAITHVATADDAHHVGGLDIAALTEEVARRVLDEVRERTGYQQLFKVLKGGDITVIEHELGTPPLVDLYQLEYFEVAAREDDETRAAFATFYLCQAEERRVRVPNNSGGRRAIDIQPPDGPDVGIPFKDMLTRYQVSYTDTSSLDDLETEFWQAFFAAPNDRFSDDQYARSPWFERCCKEQQSVKRLKDNGDWDDILFISHPRKTVNFPGLNVFGNDGVRLLARPANVGVQHLDNNRTALWFVPPHRADDGPESRARAYINDPSQPVLDPDQDLPGNDNIGRFENELKLMVLLKV
ncbi:hypothetical protein [Occultella kanbiaonis]|uniref:hypothetical protein n=1 Tax=Occultella kanbiaonis TaxID=2675754 RepID=UPI0012B6CDE0|nr:hypothetical protein [Occultella kanbiaonis]